MIEQCLKHVILYGIYVFIIKIKRFKRNNFILRLSKSKTSEQINSLDNAFLLQTDLNILSDWCKLINYR